MVIKFLDAIRFWQGLARWKDMLRKSPRALAVSHEICGNHAYEHAAERRRKTPDRRSGA